MVGENAVPHHLDDGNTPVSVLLVDDNEQWARFVASDLEAEYPSITVHLALSPNEAMLQLGEFDIDCVVADYQMPEVDGLELLERLRRERPELPYILATSEGSEDIASAAIDAGVSDYVVKDPRVDQLSVFASKIHRAVEAARLRQAMAESERRYRSLTEQSSDAILIIQDDELVFYNQRLIDLTGRPRSWFESVEDLIATVHPDDRDEVRATLRRWQDMSAGGQLDELRLQTVDGAVQHCEYTGRQISHDGETAIMLSIRDVTDRKQRQRELRWERDLNRAVQNVLVAARIRDDIEQGVTGLLVDHGYELAWIGVPEHGTLTPRAQHGATAYLTAIDLSMETGTADSEPSLWAARADESRFVDDFEELFPTDWLEQAVASGCRSGAALPLSYNEISYGVLAVYHAEPGRFDETERRLLGELADSIAFAIHTVDTEQALASDHTVELTLRVVDDAYYLLDVVRQQRLTDGESITVHGTLRHTDGQFLQYLSVDESMVGTLRTALDSHPDVSEVTTIVEGTVSRLQVVVEAATPESILINHGAVVRSTTVETSGAELVVELPARSSVRETVDNVAMVFDGTAVLSVGDTTRSVADSASVSIVDMSGLTAKQTAALEAAFHHGYFEQPRRSSATEIAEALGVAHSTFLQHLRAGQQKLFADLYR